MHIHEGTQDINVMQDSSAVNQVKGLFQEERSQTLNFATQ